MDRRELFIMLPTFFLSWFFIGLVVLKANAASSAPTVETLNITQIQSMSQMENAIDLLENTAQTARKENRFSPALQQVILSKSGECIGRLMTLSDGAGRDEGGGKKRPLMLLTQIRKTIGNIQEINKKTVSDLQENHLDKLQNPASFFNTEAWQQPNYLISL